MNLCIFLSNTTLSGDTLHLQAKNAPFETATLFSETTPQSKRKNACVIAYTKILSDKAVWKSESVIDNSSTV